MKGLLFYVRREALSIKMTFVQITIKRGSQAHGYLGEELQQNELTWMEEGVRPEGHEEIQAARVQVNMGGKLHKQ